MIRGALLALTVAIPCIAVAQQSPAQWQWFKPDNTVPSMAPAARSSTPAIAPHSYTDGSKPKPNPCTGISPEAIVATVNAHGGLGIPGGTRFRAVSVSGLRSASMETIHEGGRSTIGYVCTGYLTVVSEGDQYVQAGRYTGTQFNVELQPDGTIWFWPVAQL